ncbi:hypothetical protein GJ496_002604 [Pomphorhynchus laevis]|nr:hypothetical protein GJ496_002604 [Pomphorhynchus laevis]
MDKVMSECVNWLRLNGVLPDEISFDSAEDLAAFLRNGVVLLKLLSNLLPEVKIKKLMIAKPGNSKVIFEFSI